LTTSRRCCGRPQPQDVVRLTKANYSAPAMRVFKAHGQCNIPPTAKAISVNVTVANPQGGGHVTLFPGTILPGHTSVGDRCEIGPDARLVDTVVGDDCTVRSTFATDAEIGAGSVVGPYCHLAAGAAIPVGTVTGAFYTSS